MEEAGGGAMRLEMRGVDHQAIRTVAIARQFGKDPVEYAEPAPADEAVVDRLRRPVRRRHIAPSQAVADYEQDAAQHTPIVDPRNSVRQREIRLDPTHLRLRQQQQIIHQIQQNAAREATAEEKKKQAVAAGQQQKQQQQQLMAQAQQQQGGM